MSAPTLAGGVVTDMPEADYFTHPALSHSGAKVLLESPAKFAYQREHGQETKPEFDFGHAAHKLILGVGAPIVEVPGEWRSAEQKARVKEIRAGGGVPLHTEDVQAVHAMRDALLTHPVASRMFNRDNGTPEVSLFRQDDETGVELRSRLDWLPDSNGGRLIIVDYKSTGKSADPRKLGKTFHDFGYHSQHAWYVDMVTGLGIADDVAMVFVVQEKAAPYLLSIVEPDPEFVALGRARNRRAIDLFAECQTDNVWPGYPVAPQPIYAPRWAFTEEEAA